MRLVWAQDFGTLGLAEDGCICRRLGGSALELVAEAVVCYKRRLSALAEVDRRN